MPLVSKRKASRPAKPTLDFYNRPDSSDEEAPTVRHKFVRFDAGNDGSYSSRTTYGYAPMSPVKGSSSSMLLAFNDEPVPEIDFTPIETGNGTFLDPAYIDHLGDCVENPFGPKRIRTRSVGWTFIFVWIVFTDYLFAGQSATVLETGRLTLPARDVAP
jgi:hypothetical protein